MSSAGVARLAHHGPYPVGDWGSESFRQENDQANMSRKMAGTWVG